MKWNKRLRALAGLVLLVWGGATANAASYNTIDAIAAVVDDDVILQSELQSAMNKLAVQLRDRGVRMPPQAIFERQVLEKLISERLQLAAAKRAGIRVDDDTLNQAIAKIAARNSMSISQMRDVLERDGISFREFRQQFADEMTIQALRDREVKRRVRISDQEVEAYLARNKGDDKTEYWLSHILLATPRGASADEIDQVRQQARELVASLRGGADFGQAAVANSSGQQALEGGDLGWRSSEDLPSFFADAVRDMVAGEISEPIRSNSGFHIVMVREKRGGEQHIVTQTKAQHILIRTNEVTSDQDARTRLEQLRQRILGGADFETLARGHSDDKGSAIKGGDLGWVSPGDTVPEFEESMDELSPGQVSEPFKTEFGWHIVQVLERRNHDDTQEMRRGVARNAIGNRKLEEEWELYVRRLRDEAYVEIRLDDEGGS